jgi:Xaa-Pro aminopeptidase
MGQGFVSNDIIRQKLQQAAGALQEQDVDLWMTYVQETSAGPERAFQYIAPSHLTWESAILISRSGEKEVILGSFDAKDFEDSKLYDKVTPYVQDFKEPFSLALSRIKPRTIAVNFSQSDNAADGIGHGAFLNLTKMVETFAPEARIVSAEGIISTLISQKTPLELQAIQEAIGITTRIFEQISAYLKPGLTEKQLYDFIQGKIREAGTSPSFQTLVFAGDRGAVFGHSSATDNKIQPGDFVHVDMGVWVREYASDMQRTWYVLKPGEDRAPDNAQKGFDTIRKAIVVTGKALKPGVRGLDIDNISRKTVTDAGFPEYPHALGHQLGKEVHDGGTLLGPDWPRYRGVPLQQIKLGQVYTLEPSLNVEGVGAVGLEEDVVVTEDGARYLSDPQTEIWYVKD